MAPAIKGAASPVNAPLSAKIPTTGNAIARKVYCGAAYDCRSAGRIWPQFMRRSRAAASVGVRKRLPSLIRGICGLYVRQGECRTASVPSANTMMGILAGMIAITPLSPMLSGGKWRTEEDSNPRPPDS